MSDDRIKKSDFYYNQSCFIYFNFNFDIYNRVCNIWVKILNAFQTFV